MRKAALAASLLLLPVALSSQRGTGHLRDSFDDSLGTLARARTIQQLSSLWATAPRDYPHRAVYAALYFKLGVANQDVVLLNAMPSDGKEMETFYNAQDTRQGQDKAVTEAYSEFYPALAGAVARHPQKLPKFLRMIHAFHFVDNVDESPWLCGLASGIYHANPDEYLKAVQQVEPGFREESLACKQPPDAP